MTKPRKVISIHRGVYIAGAKYYLGGNYRGEIPGDVREGEIVLVSVRLRAGGKKRKTCRAQIQVLPGYFFSGEREYFFDKYYAKLLPEEEQTGAH